MQWHERDTNAAELYERYMVPMTFAPWAEEVVRAAGIREGAAVLDVACGTGIVARTAAPLVGKAGRVVGLDFNAGMLATARALAPAVDFHLASADDMPFPAESFDVVLCQFALMFFPDRQRALTEMYRVLRPNGYLALCIWGSLDDNPRRAVLNRVIRGYVSQELSEQMDASSRQGYGMATPEQLRSLVESIGFTDVVARSITQIRRFQRADEFIMDDFNGSPITQPLVSKFDKARREQLVAEAVEALQPYVGEDGLALPTTAIILTAKK